MLIRRVNKHIYHKELNKLKEKILSAQKLYYKNHLEQVLEMRKLRHDINEHLYCIYHLLEVARYKEAKEYIESIIGNASAIEEMTGLETGSDIVNIIVTGLIREYQNKNITLSWDGLIPELKLNYIDLCSLFWNLLNNAYEAAGRCDKGRIEVVTRSYNNALYIRISNTCLSQVQISGDILKTGKADSHKHGYGSRIVKDISKKYNCQIKYSCENHLFSVELTFPDILR